MIGNYFQKCIKGVILFVLFCTVSDGGAFSNDPEQLSAKKIDNENDFLYDRIKVVLGNRDSDRLKKPIKIYKDKSLKGKVQFVITNENIINKRSKDQASPPLGFIDYGTQERGFEIKISDYTDGLATVINRERKYYFKLSEESFQSDRFPEFSRWKKIRNKKALDLFKKLAQEDPELKALLAQAKKCLKEINVGCLTYLLKFDVNDFEESANELWRYANVNCKDGKFPADFVRVGEFSVGFNKHEERNQYPREKQLVPWTSFGRVFNLELREDEVIIQTKDLGKIDSIIIKTEEEKYCDGRAQKSLRLKFLLIEEKKQTRKWEVELKDHFVLDFASVKWRH